MALLLPARGLAGDLDVVDLGAGRDRAVRARLTGRCGEAVAGGAAVQVQRVALAGEAVDHVVAAQAPAGGLALGGLAVPAVLALEVARAEALADVGVALVDLALVR